MVEARADGGGGILAHAAPHDGRCQCGHQEALRVLRIARPVVHQVPVQGIAAAIGMAGGAALPPPDAQGGIVEVRLAQSGERGDGRFADAEQPGAECVRREIQDGEFAREISCCQIQRFTASLNNGK